MPRACAPQQEKPPQWEALASHWKSSPCLPQLEKAHAEQQGPSAAKKEKSTSKAGVEAHACMCVCVRVCISCFPCNWFGSLSICRFNLLFIASSNSNNPLSLKYKIISQYSSPGNLWLILNSFWNWRGRDMISYLKSQHKVPFNFKILKFDWEFILKKA